MNSHIDNENQEIFQEEQFRQVCFDKSATKEPSSASSAGSTSAAAAAAAAAANKSGPNQPAPPGSSTPYKRNSSSAGSTSSTEQPKRTKLDPSILVSTNANVSSTSATPQNYDSMPSPKSTYTNEMLLLKKPHHIHNQLPLSSPSVAASASGEVSASGSAVTATMQTPTSSLLSGSKSKGPKFVRRFRSRSLPIINYNSQRSHLHHHQHNSIKTSNFSSNSIPTLPPINLQSLKEIDLHEILKNPQLRHDILFDPQLQFRPNLDGERGKRKKSIIDKYWYEIQKECLQFFKPQCSNIKINRLPILFTTVRDILLSLLPTKDRQQVNEIMDIDLLIQQLNHGSFDFVEMSKWLGEVFKSHCAPMRDQWVIEMHQKFVDAYNLNSVEYLVSGLRMIFQILEAMKLDVANHQIRLLRPVLIETAVDFERDYFQTLISHQKININDSLNWFYKKFIKQSNVTIGEELDDEEDEDVSFNDSKLKPFVISAIIDLLSCRQMATEFPSTLAFDHTRLVLLRTDVRQLVCVQLCIVLFKQLAFNSKQGPEVSSRLLSPANILKVQQEILAIVTDDNGNIKWTKNISSISLQLVKKVLGNTNKLPNDMIEFSYNWLIKHIQPSSEVYGLMESKVFKDLLSEILTNIDDAATVAPVPNTTETKEETSNSELKNIAARIATLVKFHWNVFSTYYIDYIKLQHQKIQQDKINRRNIIINKKKLISTQPASSPREVTDDGNDNNNDNDNKNNGSSSDGNPATIITT